MNVEGAKRKRPGRIVIPSPEFARRILMTQASMQSAKNRYRDSSSQWRRGLMAPSAGLHVPPEEAGAWVGLIGENAFKDFVNQHFDGAPAVLDLDIRRGGDGGIDFTIFGLTIQIKTRAREDTVSLVRRADESRRLLPMPAKTHVFCQYDFEDRNRVLLLGWAWTRSIERLALRPARVGDHFNVEVDDQDLLPMSRLIDQLAYQREARQWR